ncbi:hypothetical protein DLM86_04030 [Paenibacillus flagellatus]|uniref:Uncharacterized protein n=1 Tax=Paenibacillus flagellatus TaxID=2211139 RepID=A0A2V5L0Q4_9BACL|nr:hypothetical protein DLM86_04030 [Paenibacillus flagellatus]
MKRKRWESFDVSSRTTKTIAISRSFLHEAGRYASLLAFAGRLRRLPAKKRDAENDQYDGIDICELFVVE